MLLHMVDISNPRFLSSRLLQSRRFWTIGLRDKKRMIIFNKTDCIDSDEAENIASRYDALKVSALDRTTLVPLLGAIELSLWEQDAQQTTEKN